MDKLLEEAIEASEKGDVITLRWFRRRGAGYTRAKRLYQEFLALRGQPEAFLANAGVDRNKYEVERFLVNRWGPPGAEQEQVKVWLRPKEPDAIRLLQESLKASPPIERLEPKEPGETMALISVMDLHVGMLAWHGEVGENYDTEIAIERLKKAVSYLLAQLPPSVRTIIMPIGNDLLHADTHENTTTTGTRVDVDSRWQRAFSEVVSALIRGPIAWAAEIAEVRIPIVQGNHDYQRTYYLGEVLRWYYEGRGLPVKVDNAPRLRKYIRWGKVLLGFTHGAWVKPDALPLIMANEVPEDWGASVWREWIIGHFHRKKETRYNFLAENTGVRVRVIPALASTDAWHYQQGFIGGQPEAVLTIYAEKGPIAEHYWRPVE